MSVGNNYGSPWYDRADMTRQLTNQGCDAAQIERVLGALDVGDVGILSTENLTGKVEIKQYRNFMPTPGKFDQSSFAGVMFKLETFDFMQAMRLLFEVSKQMRDTNREMRHGDRELAFAKGMDAAKELREAAKFEMIAAIVSGSMKMATGAISGLVVGLSGGTAEMLGKIVSQIGDGAAELGSSIIKYQGAGHQASQAELNAEAQKLQSKESEDADYQKTAAEFIEHVITTLRDVVRAQLETDQRIIQNM